MDSVSPNSVSARAKLPVGLLDNRLHRGIEQPRPTGVLVSFPRITRREQAAVANADQFEARDGEQRLVWDIGRLECVARHAGELPPGVGPPADAIGAG